MLIPRRQNSRLSHMAAGASSLVVGDNQSRFPNLTVGRFLYVSVTGRTNVPTPRFCLSSGSGLFIVHHFSHSPRLGPVNFRSVTTLVNLSTSRGCDGDCTTVTGTVQLFYPTRRRHSSLSRLFSDITLDYVIKGNSTRLGGFNLLCSRPARHSTQLTPTCSVIGAATCVPRSILTLSLTNGGSVFTSHRNLLRFTRAYSMRRPGRHVRQLLATLRGALNDCPRCERRTPRIIDSVRRSTTPFTLAFE